MVARSTHGFFYCRTVPGRRVFVRLFRCVNEQIGRLNSERSGNLTRSSQENPLAALCILNRFLLAPNPFCQLLLT
jgi:hypothetical protein